MAIVSGMYVISMVNHRHSLLYLLRCFPHIINISAQTVLDELKKHPRIPVIESSDDPEQAEHLEAYAQALESDPVNGSRKIVAACRASGQRRSDLRSIIKQGNERFLWGPGVVIRVLQLLRDCETRWSSTFLMSDRLIGAYPVRIIILPSWFLWY